jgi:hypothetical protein
MDPPSTFTNTLSEADPKTGSYRDPWGNRYGIAMDLNYDNKVEIHGSDVQGTVFVWSFGAKGTNEYGDSTTGDKDDVTSWKE